MILIVDDSRTVTATMRAELEAAGWQVSTASTMSEAKTRILRAGKDWQLEGVVLDMVLPDGDGRELLTWIAGILPSVPVLVCTGHESIGLAVDTMRRGAAGVIAKADIPLGLLAVKLREAIEYRHRMRTAADMERSIRTAQEGEDG